MTVEELNKVKNLQKDFASIEAIAVSFGIHKDTLRRRLLKENGLVIEAVNACRLIPLSEKIAQQNKRNE